MDAAEEQPGAEGSVQQEAEREVQGLPASSRPQGEALHPRQKRHLSRSLDLSRGSVSSRAVKHQKQGAMPTAGGHAVTPRGNLLFMCGFSLPYISDIIGFNTFLVSDNTNVNSSPVMPRKPHACGMICCLAGETATR